MSRAQGSLTFAANFMLVGAAKPAYDAAMTCRPLSIVLLPLLALPLRARLDAFSPAGIAEAALRCVAFQ